MEIQKNQLKRIIIDTHSTFFSRVLLFFARKKNNDTVTSVHRHNKVLVTTLTTFNNGEQKLEISYSSGGVQKKGVLTRTNHQGKFK